MTPADWLAHIKSLCDEEGLGSSEADIFVCPTCSPTFRLGLDPGVLRVRLRRDDQFLAWTTRCWPVNLVYPPARPLVLEDHPTRDTNRYVSQLQAMHLPPFVIGIDGTILFARAGAQHHLAWSHPQTALHALTRTLIEAVLETSHNEAVTITLRAGLRGL